MAYKAIIAGASGLIGSNLLQILLQHQQYDEVFILVRKELPVHHKKLKQVVVNFDDLDNHADIINGHALFSCLGTTKGQTPDQRQYRDIDYGYPLHLAQLAKRNGVDQFHLVSSIGADKTSATFYLKLKGELEDDLKQIELPALHIYQPSMLIGKRKNKRFAETLLGGVFNFFNPLLIGGLKKYRSIKGYTVAYAMFKNSLNDAMGAFTYTSDKIQSI